MFVCDGVLQAKRALRPFNPLRHRNQPSIAVLRTHSIQQSTDVDSSSLTSHQATAGGSAAGAGDACLSDAGDDVRSRDCDESEPLNGGQLLRQKLMDTKANVGYRLGRRKALTERRKFVSDVALVCGLVGLVVTIMETELYMADVYAKVVHLSLSHHGLNLGLKRSGCEQLQSFAAPPLSLPSSSFISFPSFFLPSFQTIPSSPRIQLGAWEPWRLSRGSRKSLTTKRFLVHFD